MKYLTISLLVLLTTLFCSTSINAQWYDLTNVPHGPCYAIDAYDSLIATGPFSINSSWIPDSLFMTTNGGNGWFAIPLPGDSEVNDDPYDISIIGSEKIWISTGRGKIYYTNNGGINWQQQFYDTLMTKFMNYLEMFDEMNGMAMGDAPASDKPALFLKTTNGGEDWISQNNAYLIGLLSGDIWRRVDFTDTNIGYFFSSGEGPQKLYKTTNGGKDWTIINDTIFCSIINGYDENIFLAEEPNGTVNRTTNGGQTWKSFRSDFLGWDLDIEFIPGNPSNVWCGSELVSFSSDTGRTWTKEIDFPYGEGILYDMVFTDENSGWIYAGGGGILTNMYRTTNGGHGGIVWVDDKSKDFLPVEFKLEKNYPNPFNPSTTIHYSIPEFSFITLKVYDVLGSEIATLINEEKPAGSYQIEFDASKLASGVYFYQLKAGDFIQTKKMVLMK